MTTIAFLHGFTGSPESFGAARAALRVECTVCTPALLGHAGGPISGATFDQEVQRLRAILRTECSRPLVLVGYSLGARLALGIAAAEPSTLAALVLISVNPGLQDAEERAARVQSDEEHAVFLEAHGTAAFLEQRWSNQSLFASQTGLSAETLRARDELRLRHDPHGLALALRSLGLGSMPELWSSLSAVVRSIPVILVTGRLDKKFCSLAATAKAQNPQIQWESLTDVGHNPLLEAPEQIARVLTTVIKSLP